FVVTFQLRSKKSFLRSEARIAPEYLQLLDNDLYGFFQSCGNQFISSIGDLSFLYLYVAISYPRDNPSNIKVEEEIRSAMRNTLGGNGGVQQIKIFTAIKNIERKYGLNGKVWMGFSALGNKQIVPPKEVDVTSNAIMPLEEMENLLQKALVFLQEGSRGRIQTIETSSWQQDFPQVSRQCLERMGSESAKNGDQCNGWVWEQIFSLRERIFNYHQQRAQTLYLYNLPGVPRAELNSCYSLLWKGLKPLLTLDSWKICEQKFLQSNALSIEQQAECSDLIYGLERFENDESCRILLSNRSDSNLKYFSGFNSKIIHLNTSDLRLGDLTDENGNKITTAIKDCPLLIPQTMDASGIVNFDTNNSENNPIESEYSFYPLEEKRYRARFQISQFSNTLQEKDFFKTATSLSLPGGLDLLIKCGSHFVKEYLGIRGVNYEITFGNRGDEKSLAFVGAQLSKLIDLRQAYNNHNKSLLPQNVQVVLLPFGIPSKVLDELNPKLFNTPLTLDTYLANKTTILKILKDNSTGMQLRDVLLGGWKEYFIHHQIFKMEDWALCTDSQISPENCWDIIKTKISNAAIR
ncbi:MAG: hypothetical protein HQK50_14300, partial [Oligoflexia bacterium]|nr:hypothetical protein [Oligoflexia bacterium]